MRFPFRSDRLLIREWTPADAEAAHDIYGSEEVARWLTPAMERVSNLDAMRSQLQDWAEAQPRFVPPCGRWAIERQEDGEVIGGLVIRLLPPHDVDLEIGWQVRRADWGRGYATEAGRLLIRWAFESGADELLAVVRPANERGIALAGRLGMQWVGETDKYYGLRLNVYRIRPADLDEPVLTPTGARSG